MSRLLVEAPGLSDTLQDLGRIGVLRLGISGSGAMDRLSHRLANRLVGNPPEAASLEVAFRGGRYRAEGDCLVAVTGGDVEILADGEPQRPWSSFLLRDGALLEIGSLRDAVYGYLAVAGGFEAEVFFDSRSTHSRSGLGGHGGRALTAGDALPLAAAPAAVTAGRRLLHPPPRLGPAETALRVVPGPQDELFTAAAWQDFLSTPYRVTGTRDRMGMVLEGKPLAHRDGYNIVSDGIVFGSIQVPGAGLPMILLADRQPTGGYPKIATVIGADLVTLVQAPPGTALRFRSVTVAQAERAAVAAAEAAARLEAAAAAAPVDLYSSEHLLSVNLIDGVVGPEPA